jgi:uncharacterized protein YecE (DUF72 family)
MSQFRIGISGWTYAPWRGVFYPKGLVQKKELEYASRQLNSIEINGTFYSLQKPASYRKWVDETPDDFIFSVKGPKYITHMKKLIDVQTPLANFFASGVLLLGKKFGPILWQFPPWWHYDEEKLEQFLEMLPRTTEKAAELASDHTLKNKDGFWTEAVTNKKLQYAFEPRHQSFFTESFIRLLRKHNAALVFADSAGKWPFAEDLTADIVYIRLHGSKELYASGYTDEELDRWAERIKLWTKGKEPEDATLISAKESKPKNERDIYVYFDNDIKVHAPFDAIHLAERLGIAPQGT